MGKVIKFYPVFNSLFNKNEREHIISIATLGITEVVASEYEATIDEIATDLAWQFVGSHTVQLDTSNRIKGAHLSKERGFQLIEEMKDAFTSNYQQSLQSK